MGKLHIEDKRNSKTMDLIKTKTIGKYRIDIVPDDDPAEPRGDIYGYVITDEENDVEIDNCFGYSDIKECLKEAKRVVECCIKEDKKQH